MDIKQLNETESIELLKIAQEGEIKLKEMSDRATIMAEKWRVKMIPRDNSERHLK